MIQHHFHVCLFLPFPSPHMANNKKCFCFHTVAVLSPYSPFPKCHETCKQAQMSPTASTYSTVMSKVTPLPLLYLHTYKVFIASFMFSLIVVLFEGRKEVGRGGRINKSFSLLQWESNRVAYSLLCVAGMAG